MHDYKLSDIIPYQTRQRTNYTNFRTGARTNDSTGLNGFLVQNCCRAVPFAKCLKRVEISSVYWLCTNCFALALTS